MNAAKLLYFADIFCPWCYAFAPSVLRLSREYPDISVHVVGGHLIGQPTNLINVSMRDPGLGQFWRSVQEESGRSFTGILEALATHKDICVDSIGADALFMTLARLAPGHDLEQFTGLESLFFADGADLFAEDTLAELATKWGVSLRELRALAAEPAMRGKAGEEIDKVREVLGQAAFPTVYLIRGKQGEFVSQGYVPYETVAARMGDVLRDLHVAPLVPHERMSRVRV